MNDWNKRAARIRETMDTPGWKDIEKMIDGKIESFDGMLLNCPLNAVTIVRGKIKVLQMIKYKVKKMSKHLEPEQKSKKRKRGAFGWLGF